MKLTKSLLTIASFAFAATSQAVVVFSTVDGSGGTANGGFTAAPAATNPLDMTASTQVSGTQTGGFPGYNFPGTNDISALVGPGVTYTMSYEVLLPGGATSNITSLTSLIRFYRTGTGLFTDPDGAGPLVSPFANRVENPNDAGANFGNFSAAQADASLATWQTVTYTGAVPEVDTAGNAITDVAVQIGFQSVGGATATEPAEFFIRNINFEVVPEPSSTLLLGLGGLALLRRRR